MNLSIPNKYAALIQQAVASGEFATPEDAVQHALELFAEEQSAKSEQSGTHVSDEERRKRVQLFREWLKSRKPAGHYVDDNRESIY